MKLVRYGAKRSEKPGLIDDEGKLRDLSTVVEDIAGDVLTEAGMQRLRDVAVDRSDLGRGALSRVPAEH